MMALARADVRRFRAVARRAQRPGQPRGPAPPVRIVAESGTVTMTAHLGEVVVALRAPTDRPGDGSVTVSMDALSACEGGTGEATLQPGRKGAVTVRWTDGSDQQKATFDPPEVDLAWPAEPEHLVAMAPHLPGALHEAGRSAARDPGKYAVTRVQVRGKAGEVIGTDGKQALVWVGFVPFRRTARPGHRSSGPSRWPPRRRPSPGGRVAYLHARGVWLRVDRGFPGVRGPCRGHGPAGCDPDARALLALCRTAGTHGPAGHARPRPAPGVSGHRTVPPDGQVVCPARRSPDRRSGRPVPRDLGRALAWGSRSSVASPTAASPVATIACTWLPRSTHPPRWVPTRPPKPQLHRGGLPCPVVTPRPWIGTATPTRHPRATRSTRWPRPRLCERHSPRRPAGRPGWSVPSDSSGKKSAFWPTPGAASDS